MLKPLKWGTASLNNNLYMIAGQTSFQDAASPTIIALVQFHDYSMTIIVFIRIYVAYVFVCLITYNSYSAIVNYEDHELERVWTLLPSVCLIFLAIPSLRLLYIMEERNDAILTIKAVGHQWYWSYDYADFYEIDYDSYIVEVEGLEVGRYRLLEVDYPLVIPWGIETRILVTAADVIHSWTVPRMGIKVDAVPGRLNQVSFSAIRPGHFFGQCSEICGANHSFIPICVEVVDPKVYEEWIDYMCSVEDD